MFDEIVTKEGLKFNDLEKKIYKFVCMLGCFIIKYILESRDRKLMKARDTKKFRHKGYKNNCIKTIMGEVEYKRAVYLLEEDGEKKYVYLLDEDMKIETIGKVSVNLAEKALSIAVNTTSYRKGEDEIRNTTKGTLSHEGLRHLVIETGKKIEQKEETEAELYDQEKLIKGTKEIAALFEETDGLWVNLQGKDRNEQIEKYKKQCEKKGKEYKKPKSVKTELKLHVTYEGWKKDDERHSLVNKSYIAGMMSSKKLEKIRNARLYQKYDLDKVKLRVMNGDGARWIKNNKQHRANRKETEENIGATKNVLKNARFMKEIMKERSFSQMGYII